MTMTEPEFVGDAVDMSAGEFAAQWGDGKTDDGCMFYSLERNCNDVSWLDKFVAAIGRLLNDIGRNPDKYGKNDSENLLTLRTYCQERLESINRGEMVESLISSSDILENQNGCKISYADIRKAMNGEPFDITTMSIKEKKMIAKAINVGIDSRLQACFVPDRGDKISTENGRMAVEFSIESFPVFLRRLFEMVGLNDTDDTGTDLGSGCLEVLGFNDTGKFVGRK